MYLENNNNKTDEHSGNEDNKNILLKDALDDRKDERDEQRRRPVGEYAHSHSRVALVLAKAFGCVDERNGPQTDGEQHNEDDYASDAQQRVNLLAHLASTRHKKCDFINTTISLH